MSQCLFCRIAAGEVPCQALHEDGQCIAFSDIAPQAPVHFLVVPKAHIPSAAALTQDNAPLAGHLLAVAADLARRQGLESYRVVSNVGAEAGQSVPHLHFHVLSGREMTWPPG